MVSQINNSSRLLFCSFFYVCSENFVQIPPKSYLSKTSAWIHIRFVYRVMKALVRCLLIASSLQLQASLANIFFPLKQPGSPRHAWRLNRTVSVMINLSISRNNNCNYNDYKNNNSHKNNNYIIIILLTMINISFNNTTECSSRVCWFNPMYVNKIYCCSQCKIFFSVKAQWALSEVFCTKTSKRNQGPLN